MKLMFVSHFARVNNSLVFCNDGVFMCIALLKLLDGFIKKIVGSEIHQFNFM